jgi:peptidoglycan/LPS O-acetylase OafA/YrhL
MNEPVRHHRIDEIECLRAVAILFTLIHHAFFYLLIKAPPFEDTLLRYATFWGGVDLFFVISGFVIFRDLMSKKKKISYWRNTGAFWLRRAWRILPSAWLWLVIYLLVTLFLNSSGAIGHFENNLTDSLAAFFQVANFQSWRCMHAGTCGPNGVYWSLSLEEQFYLLLPIVIFIFGRKLRYFFLFLLVVQFFIRRPVWSLIWAVRTDTFIWGCLLAMMSKKDIYQKLEPRFLNMFPFVKWIVVPMLIIAMALIPAAPNGVPLPTSLLGVVCCLLVYLASYDRGYLMAPGFFRRGLVWLGGRSYSLYLTHVVLFRVAIELWYRAIGNDVATADHIWPLTISALLLVFAASELNYRFVEQPLRRYGKRLVATLHG